MLSQAFSTKSLGRMVKFREAFRFGLIGKKAVRSALNALLADIHAGTFAFKSRSVHQTKKGAIFSTKDYPSILVQRKLNENIKALYKVKQANRQLIVSQIMALLQEDVPKHIIKLDISKFYESVDRNVTLVKIKKDPLLSLESKRLLAKLYADGAFNGFNGFPRGLCTSATLSELHLRDFDKTVLSMDGVYYYTRYVDDIIIFTFKEPSRILSDVRDILALRFGLRANDSKTQVISISSCVCKPNCKCGPGNSCECKNSCVCKKKFKDYSKSCIYPTANIPDNMRSYPNNKRSFVALDYLGYRMYSPPITGAIGKDSVFINISPKKVAKIKTRIVLSFKKFEADNDYDLLRSRIEFLCSNIKINKRHNSLSSGIFFNYPLVMRSSKEAKDLRQFDALEELDVFLRNILFVDKFRIGKVARSRLTLSQRRTLAGLSFARGFSTRFMIRIGKEKRELIAMAWTHEKN